MEGGGKEEVVNQGRVFLRCRPFNAREKSEGSPPCVKINAKEGLIEMKNHKDIS